MRSDELATLTRPIFVECLAAFGSGRIMLESNFPIDRRDYGYTTIWNAFEILARPPAPDERDELFWRTAARFYKIDMPVPQPSRNSLPN